MEGLGLLLTSIFLILIGILVFNACTPLPFLRPAGLGPGKEGFMASSSARQPGPVPPKTSVTGRQEPTGVVEITDLPSAPIIGLAEANALPYQDPVLQKASLALLNELKKDMDGFAAFEMPGLEEKSDPAVKLPLTRFRGDHQRLKDEVSVLSNNPGLQSQLTVADIDDAAANLRFLQRTYRLYAANQIVPPVRAEITKVGWASGEGFENPSDSDPISVDELKLLSQRLAVEIVRLQSSGTTDPVTTTRVGIFSKMRQQVDDTLTKINNGTLKAADIPIKKADYNKFLPALGSTSSGISNLLSKSGNGTLSSLFDNYDAGDISGSTVVAALVEKYAEDILKGLSYSLKVTYTSPNEVAKANSVAVTARSMEQLETNHPKTTAGARGAFEEQIRSMDIAGFDGAGPGGPIPGTADDSVGGAGDYPNSSAVRGGSVGVAEQVSPGNPRPAGVLTANAGKFDWEARATQVCERIRQAGLNPGDYGCLPGGTQVSSDYSWRGHTKMVCTRLATNADPAIPEQMGCPPVNWKGWRL